MNKENAHLFLPLVQALADGKQLQYIPHRGNLYWEDFEKDEEIGFSDDPENYRIKPEPRTFEVWVDSFSNYLYPISTTPYYNWERINVQEVQP